MTGKRYKVNYVIPPNIIDTETGEHLPIEDVCKLLNKYECDKTVIYNKLINYILDYDEIAQSNYDFGVRDTVKSLHEDVASLFKDPLGFTMQNLAYECKNWNGEKCILTGEILDECDVCNCNKFIRKR